MTVPASEACAVIEHLAFFALLAFFAYQVIEYETPERLL